MTDVEERLALADKLDAAADWMQRYLDTFGELGDDATQANINDWHEAVKAARLSASPAPGGVQACVNKALEFETRWELAASNDELRSNATRHRHYATAAKLIRQELAAIAALPAPATVSGSNKSVTEDELRTWLYQQFSKPTPLCDALLATYTMAKKDSGL